MLIERHMMNVLFYVGILLPTAITIVLFVLFLVCWRRLKARKEMLNKLYDPHKKLRDLGMPRVPPPPPIFVHESHHARLAMAGEENTGYDVSRSPSGNQDQLGRQLYHAPHDSGLSDLSEMQCKDRPYSQASQGSTDSEDSGFRSSRSGQFNQKGNATSPTDAPLLKSIKCRKDRQPEVVAAVAVPQCEKMCVRNDSAAVFPSNNLSPSAYTISEQTPHPKVDINDISTHISWMYLQNLTSRGDERGPAVTTAQVHCSNPSAIHSDGDLFGFSVV
ncbi:uncharacterized protein LOC121380070 [Gigantopelta aegis]|uniref:uncharacterized protein LOC121380070 n=1 Tax=Gigantopelta aegis TaxID=1735272 RepID=UPI001B8877D6|nr:uncharacterized protein LOC121380070 [Gigantopelta aegis]XP_041364749.1 uncharacterized protein LOC121380070 [Gigantopelta aegis]XP_041364750.1 uncharacterized protein LOC121380070 [Gigantopelta aegis]XP_041364751.1 uncharacterized protein LOC121380070 [Gigantopelta aegis]XP_041364752.1 uncharacterized protein LOC121380070 [Gigantopelta aegis]XP_041364753.1 uncharacterized protein LOC121380070 [Gigantopelta aegis]